MSLFTRLYRDTRNRVWLESALRALQPFRLPVSEGGVVVDFHGFPWYEEYPTRKPTYTLNGFMFALIGLHDLAPWSAEAGRLYWGGRRALIDGLPHFTVGTGLYHLGHLVRSYGPRARFPATPDYNRIHVRLLEEMESQRPHPVLTAAREKFQSYLPR
jgi:hypothetical protein